ncbi:TetR/AcrR family transcriptional regulator [Paenibacillus rhizovicinus]|uniref:TetR/AcrR family transcriptional regulator n=1 Tax=Paenibacillus rhizovicinus TaxID=2704463 RepID=A0A6C0NTX7_9BACL|nr:TetR/AcrR family transcriptional regulator [Paenibacillus rhizovicinus]QHW29618.1 TetR/AcrR family transcriptional regulator [Paenibacillus rhizovicinus]
MKKSFTRTQKARREDIVSAAIAVINREGYAAASVDKIAQEAETSKSTVLYHFKTKEAIYDEVVVTLYQTGAAIMTERIMAVETCRDKLCAYLSSNLSFIAEHAAHVNAVHRIIENGALKSDVPDAVTPLATLLSSGQKAGDFGSFDPLVTALAIRAVVDGASFYFANHPDLDFEHYINETIQLFDKATALS